MQEGKAIHDFDCKGIISRNLNQDNLHKTRYAKDALIVKMLRCIFTAETLLFPSFSMTTEDQCLLATSHLVSLSVKDVYVNIWHLNIMFLFEAYNAAFSKTV